MSSIDNMNNKENENGSNSNISEEDSAFEDQTPAPDNLAWIMVFICHPEKLYFFPTVSKKIPRRVINHYIIDIRAKMLWTEFFKAKLVDKKAKFKDRTRSNGLHLTSDGRD